MGKEWIGEEGQAEIQEADTTRPVNRRV